MKNIKQNNAKATRLKQIKRENIFFLPWIKANTAITDIYIFAKTAREALITYRQTLIKSESFFVEIEIPTKTGSEQSQLDKKSYITDITKKAIRTGIFSNALVSMVAVTEGYFEDIARIILRKYPQKLAVAIDKQDKENAEKSIPLSVILSANSRDEIITELIDKKLINLLYAKPEEYFTYFEKALSINLDKDTLNSFIEIKASRDLIVHNGGKVNDIYIRKSGGKCRTKNTRQIIPVDANYFLFATGIMKRLLKDIYETSSQVYLKKTHPKDLFP